MKCMYYVSFSAIFVFTNCRGSPWGGEPGDSKLVLAAVEFGLLSQDGGIHGIAWLRRSPVVVPWAVELVGVLSAKAKVARGRIPRF